MWDSRVGSVGGIRKCGIREWGPWVGSVNVGSGSGIGIRPIETAPTPIGIWSATATLGPLPHRTRSRAWQIWRGMSGMGEHVRAWGGDVRAWGGMPGHGGAWRCMGGAARRVGSGELCGCRAASASLLCRTKSLIVRAVISHGSQSSLRAASGILRCCFILSLALTQLCRP